MGTYIELDRISGVSVYWKKVKHRGSFKIYFDSGSSGFDDVGNADVGEGEINKVNGCGHRQVHLTLW